ncbi:protein kinase domain-containing protein [Pseudomonas rhodesiae]|uniref:Serine/threonine protein kinase n=1 Tax=Pseudomonas rhodesiae TaxID=76760 RepID=A0AAE8HGB4_9PSED|nr:protein kinase [Pseudomonas rhodesiae]TWR54590.1 serine/threonine protein kinase [Pseudomonas rhodesiae]SDV13863.1 serine/threonine protein kinase [Pseudomonas rhodesiae]
MPDLSQDKIDELKEKLVRYLTSRRETGEAEFLAAGGSAAVFKASVHGSIRAFKVFDPKFISAEEGSKEKERLKLQSRLINHECENLVQTYDIKDFDDTAIIEMEYLEWPQLKAVLKNVPDESVSSLINQLINAVRFLESYGIVHRDIKPENIHVSEDWLNLKLLDLGVVREFDPGPDAAETDQGNQRPFLATAQYSSPEYLFRLDEPSISLWQGLNLYQVGAVLHDLIMKEPVFRAEMEAGNRWLVAKAVLLHPPSFQDANSNRLAYLKSLSAKCLGKDLSVRLALVSWEDFGASEGSSGLASLKHRIKARPVAQPEHENVLKFHRQKHQNTLIEKVRFLLISACGTDLPLEHGVSHFNNHGVATFQFDCSKQVTITIHMMLQWQDGLYSSTANVLLAGRMIMAGGNYDFPSCLFRLTNTTTLESSGEVNAEAIAEDISNIVAEGLTLFDSNNAVGGPLENLNNYNLASKDGTNEQ